MKWIDPDEIRVAIESAERRTSAEIVVAVSPFFIGRVAHAARRAFARLGVADTHGRNGVLIFMVPKRHQVFVLPDAEAEARVDPVVWQRAAAEIATGFGNGHATDGLVDAIIGLGDDLGYVFPPGPAPRNQLANEVRRAPRSRPLVMPLRP